MLHSIFTWPVALWLAVFAYRTSSMPYDPDQVQWNLNQNRTATDPIDYWGEWGNHSIAILRWNWDRKLLTQSLSIQPFTRQLALSVLYPHARPIRQWRPEQ